MMFPIAQAVLHELHEGKQNIEKNGVVNNGTEFPMTNTSNHNKGEEIEIMDAKESLEQSKENQDIVR